MTTCPTCGGSGILNVEAAVDPVEGPWVPEASPCHDCPAGALWAEVGLE